MTTKVLLRLAAGLLCALSAGCLAEAGQDDEQLAEEGDESFDSAEMELGPNLLKNGGFESGWNHWEKVTESGGTLKRITGSGTYIRTTDPSLDGVAFVSQKVSVTPGKKYHLLVKTRRRSGPGNPEFGITFPETSSSKWITAGKSKAWHWRTMNLTAPPGAHTAYVTIGGFMDVIAPGASPSASTYDWDGIGLHAY